MDKNKELIQKFADTAHDLAQSVKDNIVHEGVITDETVIKLNNFIIASNAVADMLDLIQDDNESDGNLN